MSGSGWSNQVLSSLIVGSNPGPFIVTENVNFPISQNVLPANVSSFGTLRAVVAFVSSPSAPVTASTPMQGPISITYTDSSVAPAYLILSGFAAGSTTGTFILGVGSVQPLGTAGMIRGQYLTSGNTIILYNGQGANSSQFIEYIDLQLTPSWYANNAAAPAPAGTTLFPGAETWHLMTLLNSWANVGGAGDPLAAYRLTAGGDVELVGRISHAAVSGTSQIASLPAAYTPTKSISMPVSIFAATNVFAAATQMPRLRLDNAGALTFTNLPAGTTDVAFAATAFLNVL